MLQVFRIILFVSVHFIITKCFIPDLSVQKLDRSLIAKKRQDTLEMCRLFNAETEKTKDYSVDKYFQNKGKRFKRDTKVQWANEEAEKARRVESVVDKLYEDMEENGEPVTYRRRNLDSFTTSIPVQSEEVKNKTMRRFNFAPAELLGPSASNVAPLNASSGPRGMDWHKQWKNGILPYYIDSKTYDTQLAEVIVKAFDYFEKATCIRLQRLKDRPTDKNSLQFSEWLYISNPSGVRQCVHSNERKTNRGVQMVVFGYDCLSLGEIIHEVMHILGFSHEHTRPDREHYITILWNNIKPGYKKYFEIRTYDPLLNIPYDYASVLHYPPRAFSKNGQTTLMAHPGTRIGQREGLSEGDVEKVARVFGSECVERNRQYLVRTCPSVVKATQSPARNVTQEEIEDYFKDRIWPYGIVNYKLKDQMEFSAEEKENIKAVIRHIEKETCIQFRDISTDDEDDVSADDKNIEEKGADGLIINIKEKEQEQERKEIETSTSDSQSESLSGAESGIEKIRLTTVLNEMTTTRSDADNEINHNDDEVQVTGLNNEVRRKGAEKPRKPNVSKSRKSASKSSRRHASDILYLVRSVEPGCECPNPGCPHGNQELKINADCFNSVNDLLHLFVHVLGLDHQHNMHDRDSYLHILWDNLSPEIKKEMSAKLPPAASLGFDYDYQSVMHFPWLQIKNGFTNMMYPIWNDGWAMGRWQGLSSTDVYKLNLIYYEQCSERKKNSVSL